MDDEELLSRAEEALTEIKVAQGLSERQEAVLAALRIRLKGSAGKSLEEMLEARMTPRRTGSGKRWRRPRVSARRRWTTCSPREQKPEWPP